jgi:hypothetical protein
MCERSVGTYEDQNLAISTVSDRLFYKLYFILTCRLPGLNFIAVQGPRLP